MTDTTNKYPYDIETPLDRRAMTIDILAGEIERKNKSIKYWKEKAYYHRDYAEKFQEENIELKKHLLRVCQLLINKNKSLTEKIKKYKPERTIN